MGNRAMAKKRQAKMVLVIEDDADILSFISRVLELEGYRVLEAPSAEMGMGIIKENPVDLVLLDLRLPGRTGWSVLQEIRHDTELAKVPVIVITAIADTVQRRRILQMGVNKYLIKPISAHSLAKNIAEILHQRGRCQTIPQNASKQN